MRRVRKRDREEAKAPAGSTMRCAIYTRKSSDEGLDQEFNSLDAQREAGEAFIASQRSEGWACLPDRYDDGGFSGGSMDRPALDHLLRDTPVSRPASSSGWTACGQPPLGYRVENKRLVIVPEEADLVRRIFHGYFEHRSLVTLSNELKSAGHTTKRWVSSTGRTHGGKPLTTTYLRKVLNNRTYLGMITHKGDAWPGLSPQILKRALTGTLPPRTTMRDLYRAAETLDWSHQESMLCLQTAERAAGAETQAPADASAVAHP